MLYHLNNFDCRDISPVSWSPAYESITELFKLLFGWEIEYVKQREMDKESNLRSLLQLLTHILSNISPVSFKTSPLKTAIQEIIRRYFDSSNNDEESMESGAQSDNIWIVKPVGLSCGENIVVRKGLLATWQAVAALQGKCVVQKYIERPLLVRDQRKFDIRQWVLVTSLTPLVVYGFSEPYLRLSNRRYSTDNSCLDDPLVHLTNFAIQKLSLRDSDQTVGEAESDVMMTIAEFDADEQLLSSISTTPWTTQVAEMGMFRAIVQPQIRDICLKAVASVSKHLDRIESGFEWLGVDIMVTDSWEAKLIEVNTSPDISYSTTITKRLVDAAVSDLFTLLMDEDEGSRHVDHPAHLKSAAPHWSAWEVVPVVNESIKSVKSQKILKADCRPIDSSLVEVVLESCVQVLTSRIVTAPTADPSKGGDEDEDEL